MEQQIKMEMTKEGKIKITPPGGNAIETESKDALILMLINFSLSRLITLTEETNKLLTHIISRHLKI
jgi:hypothetical protein